MDLESYKKKFAYICNNCEKFTRTYSEYCENCGTFSSIRNTNDNDYTAENIIKQNKYKTIRHIPEEELKKSLTRSIIIIIITPFLALFGLSFSYITTTGIYVLLFSLMLMAMGIISLIFYFINPEITYGMLMSKKKVKNFDSQYMKIGSRISMGIFGVGLCVMIVVLIAIINTILRSS